MFFVINYEVFIMHKIIVSNTVPADAVTVQMGDEDFGFVDTHRACAWLQGMGFEQVGVATPEGPDMIAEFERDREGMEYGDLTATMVFPRRPGLVDEVTVAMPDEEVDIQRASEFIDEQDFPRVVEDLTFYEEVADHERDSRTDSHMEWEPDDAGQIEMIF